jgi:hypothetical protein
MIPRIEDLLVEELERRIVEAMPETAPGSCREPETFVTTFETRRFTPCIQEQENVRVYGAVQAELSVIFYSQKERCDFTPLYVSFARNPCIQITEGVSVTVKLDRCEAAEGPYLSNDAWLIKAEYYIFEIEDAHEWQPPRAGGSDALAPDIFPRPEPDASDEPEAHV